MRVNVEHSITASIDPEERRPATQRTWLDNDRAAVGLVRQSRRVRGPVRRLLHLK